MSEIADLILQLTEQLFGIAVSGPALVAVAGFFALVVNLLKQVKVDGSPIIPDGWGGVAVIIGELLAVAVVAGATQLGVDLAPYLGALDILGKLLIAVAGMFGISLSIHTLGRRGGVPFFKPRE